MRLGVAWAGHAGRLEGHGKTGGQGKAHQIASWPSQEQRRPPATQLAWGSRPPSSRWPVFCRWLCARLTVSLERGVRPVHTTQPSLPRPEAQNRQCPEEPPGVPAPRVDPWGPWLDSGPRDQRCSLKFAFETSRLEQVVVTNGLQGALWTLTPRAGSLNQQCRLELVTEAAPPALALALTYRTGTCILLPPPAGRGAH